MKNVNTEHIIIGKDGKPADEFADFHRLKWLRRVLRILNH